MLFFFGCNFLHCLSISAVQSLDFEVFGCSPDLKYCVRGVIPKESDLVTPWKLMNHSQGHRVPDKDYYVDPKTKKARGLLRPGVSAPLGEPLISEVTLLYVMSDLSITVSNLYS